MAQVFFVGVESNDFSEFDTAPTGSAYNTDAAAALGGTSFGIEMTPTGTSTQEGIIDDGATFSLFETSITTARFNFRIDINDLDIEAGEEVLSVLTISAGEIFGNLFSIGIIAGNKLFVDGKEDDGSDWELTQSNSITLSGDTSVQIVIKKATNDSSSDGSVRLRVDGTSRGLAQSLDNFDIYEAVNSDGSFILDDSSSGAITGSYYLDNISLVQSSVSEYTLPAIPKPCDVDADGTNLYIAVLDSLGEPVLIQFDTGLATDGTVVFEPAGGDDIGVQCGRFDNDVIWVGGKFSGTDKLAKSSDGGTSFVTADDGSFADIEAFVVGPDSDDRVLVADATIEVQETTDSGSNWTQINSSTGFNINAIARLGINVQEAVFGNDSAGSDNIDYSVNSGDDMEDISSGFPEQDVTSLIVN